MRERGHDLLGHGWRWNEPWTFTRDEEREPIARAIETFERVLGSRPAGWNSRSWPSENTRSLLLELGGFIYHSEGYADDVPYYESIDGTPMLVVPYSKTYNDARYLMNPGFASPRDFLDTLTMGLDELAREGGDRRTHDDGRGARALERPGRARGRDEEVHRARAGDAGRPLHAARGHRALVARHLSARDREQQMKCVVYRGTGGPEVIAIEERPDPLPSKFEVLIAPTFSGMNPADVLQRLGKHPVPPGSPKDVPGLETAGTIVAVGDGVSAFEVGDRAMGLVGGGGHASRVRRARARADARARDPRRPARGRGARGLS